MGLVAKTKKIDGDEYEVTQFLARTANRIQHRIARVLLPLIGTGLGALDLNEVDQDRKVNVIMLMSGIDGETLGLAFMRALNAMEENEYIDFILTMLESTRINNVEAAPTPEDYDMNFAGKTKTIPKLLLFVMEANNLLPFEINMVIGKVKEFFQDEEEKPPEQP